MLNKRFLFLDPKARMPVFNARKSKKSNMIYGILEGYIPSFTERFEAGMGKAEYDMLLLMRQIYLITMRRKHQYSLEPFNQAQETN